MNLVAHFSHGSCSANCTHDHSDSDVQTKSDSDEDIYHCEFDCEFQGTYDDVKVHENDCPKKKEEIIQNWSGDANPYEEEMKTVQKWNSLCHKICEQNSEDIRT